MLADPDATPPIAESVIRELLEQPDKAQRRTTPILFEVKTA